jgi:sugar/nucleoside kinase (ribokinase family)
LETRLNVLENFNPIIPDQHRSPDIVVLGNLSPEVQIKALEQLKRSPALIILDTMNFWMDHFRSKLDEVIKKVDVISINDEEARQLTGEHSLVKAAKLIHQLGPRYVIIKKGEHGALLFHDNEIFSAPALPLAEVYDPTGAGDSFAGGFAGYLTQTLDFSFNNMKSAVIYGSAMASFTVEKFGTDSIVNSSVSGMANRLKAFKELTTFEIEF